MSTLLTKRYLFAGVAAILLSSSLGHGSGIRGAECVSLSDSVENIAISSLLDLPITHRENIDRFFRQHRHESPSDTVLVISLPNAGLGIRQLQPVTVIIDPKNFNCMLYPCKATLAVHKTDTTYFRPITISPRLSVHADTIAETLTTGGDGSEAMVLMGSGTLVVRDGADSSLLVAISAPRLLRRSEQRLSAFLGDTRAFRVELVVAFPASIRDHQRFDVLGYLECSERAK